MLTGIKGGYYADGDIIGSGSQSNFPNLSGVGVVVTEARIRRDDIEGLVKLLNIRESKINLIPFNEYPESSFKKPSESRVKWFQDQLLKRGYVCTTRTTKGDDILA